MLELMLQGDHRMKVKPPTEMCSGSEAGSYLRLIDFVYHSTLGLRVMMKNEGRATLYPLIAKLQNVEVLQHSRLNLIGRIFST